VSAPDARHLIRSAIWDLGAGVARRPVIHGDPNSGTIAEPEPLAGIRAATALRYAAGRAIADCARYAREDGKTWTEIGEAMGYKPNLDTPDPLDCCGTRSSVGESAFRAVASDLGRGPSFAWTCPVCSQTVIDKGPGDHPEDAETGHGDGCKRLAATVQAWNAQWEDDSE
jgi:hypothetical protein